MLVTEGFRDFIEMAFENRFEAIRYLDMDKPPPLVPRDLRFGVRRAASTAAATVLRAAGRGGGGCRSVPKLDAAISKAVAIGYMHAYLDGAHERRTRDILLAHPAPDLSVTLHAERSLTRDPRIRTLVDGDRERLRASR